MTFALGTSRGRIAKAPLLLIDVETEEGITGRAYLWSATSRAAMPAIASILQRGRGAHQGRAHRSGRALGEARRALRADRRAGHRAHGDGGLRHRLLGRARGRGRRAAGAAARRRAAADPGLQLLRPRPDADRARSPTRPRSCSAARLPRDQAAAWLSDARRGPRRGSRRAQAHRRATSR